MGVALTMTRPARRVAALAVVFTLAALLLAALTVDAAAPGPAATPQIDSAALPPDSATSSTTDAVTPEAEQTATPVAAGEGGAFSITAVGLFAGTFKVGEWFPIDVTIENHGPDTEIEVRATTGPDGSESTFIVPLDLPAGTRKTVTLYTLPESLPRTFDVVAVQMKGGDAVASTQVRINPLFPSDTLCGVAGYKSGALAALGRVQAAGAQPGMGGAGPVVLAPIDLATFPTAAQSLFSFDCIVIGGAEGTDTLSPEQQAALNAWVFHGGQLIVATGEGWQSALASIPPDLLPVSVESSQALSDLAGVADIAGGAPPSGAAVVTTAQLKDGGAGGTVLAAAGDLPLVVERSAGDGRLTFLAFDPAVAPIADWDDADSLWKSLLRPRLDPSRMGLPPDLNPRQMESAQIVNALSQIPALDLPSIRLLAALLGAYILAVSPLNFLVLRKLNKLHWAWVSTIALIGVFAAGAYGLGAHIRGNDVIVNAISVIQGDGTARTYVGLFSPSKSSYEVEVGGGDGNPVLLSAMPASLDPFSMTGGTGGGTMVQGAPAVVRDLGVSQWASRYFMAEHHPTDAPRVSADLRFEDDGLVGTITNPSDVALHDCAVFVGSRVLLFGDLGPGETRDVNLSLAGPDPNVNGTPLSLILLGIDPNVGWVDLSNNRELQARQMILDTVFGYGFSGPVQPAGVNFIGWSVAPAVPIDVAGHKVASINQTLLTTPLSASYGTDQISIPAGVLVPELSNSEAESAFVSSGDIQVFNGSADFDFALPAGSIPSTVAEMTLHFPAQNMMGALPQSISIYDWEADSFVELDSMNGDVPLDGPTRFLDPQRGIVRIHIEVGPNVYVYLSADVSITGSR